MATYTSNINITSSRLADGWVDAWLSSETETTATIYWEIGCRQKSAALYGQEAYGYVDGSYVGYTSGYLTSSSSSWKTVCSTSGYKTVNKTTSGRNVPVTVETRVTPINGYGSVTTGWVSATVNVWVGAKPTYTITYNANGGSGAPSSQTYAYATSGTTNLSSTIPTRAGYTFLGWSLSSTATSPSYTAGQAWNLSNASNYTLYAVWEEIIYTITYDANGGEGTFSSQTKKYGETLTLHSAIPNREGYSFIGWGTSANATAASYSAGGSFTANENTSLYAVWSLIVVCSIAYDSNGGTGSPESQLHEAGDISYISNIKPTRDKYSFSGWALDSSATKAVYLSGGTYVNDDFANGDVITLYAVWTRKYDVFVRVPEGRNIKDICVRLPKGLFDNSGSIYEDKQLETLDGLELLDSQDDYIVVRGV